MIKKLFSIVCLLIVCQMIAGEKGDINDLENVSGKEFPWLVSILNSKLDKICTAVLINSHWALTSTFCGTQVQVSVFAF